MTLTARFFAMWEHRLARAHGDVKQPEPFSFGCDELGISPDGDPLGVLKSRAAAMVRSSHEILAVEAPPAVTENADGLLEFRSRVGGRSCNEVVRVWYRPSEPCSGVVLIVPHWNAPRQSLLAMAKIANLNRYACAVVSLPYHDERRPPEDTYAKGLVNANLGLTLASVLQGASDVIDTVSILLDRGHSRVVLMGFSIGSCVASLVDAHDPRVEAVLLHLMAGDFAGCVWDGISTVHIRSALEPNITLEDLAEVWAPISPESYVSSLTRMSRRRRFILSARYDLTFPRPVVTRYRDALNAAGVPHEWRDWPCGHYTLGRLPFSIMLAWKVNRILSSLRS